MIRDTVYDKLLYVYTGPYNKVLLIFRLKSENLISCISELCMYVRAYGEVVWPQFESHFSILLFYGQFPFCLTFMACNGSLFVNFELSYDIRLYCSTRSYYPETAHESKIKDVQHCLHTNATPLFKMNKKIKRLVLKNTYQELKRGHECSFVHQRIFYYI